MGASNIARVGRDRQKNKRHPIGWAPGPPSKKTGARVIYFRPTNDIDRRIVHAITGGPLSLRLGANEDEAAITFARLIVAARDGADAKEGTVAHLVKKARESYLPRIQNEDTRDWRERHLDELATTFGTRRYARNVHEASRAARGTYLTAMEVQAHLDAHAAKRHVAVNRAVKTWEIVFHEARRRWGLTEYNPCSGLSFNPEAPRDVLPANKSIAKVYRKLDPPMRFMVQMIRYYGRRRGELLGLHLGSEQDDGLHLMRGKARSGRKPKEIIHRWEPKLRALWTRLMRWRATVKRDGTMQTTMAILNRDGKPYTTTGFNSAWRRAQVRAGLARRIEVEIGGKTVKRWERDFTFHDLRSRAGSDAATVEEAQVLLAHDDQATTVGHYRRGPHVIDLSKKRNLS